ncbi:hypothetical protein N7468_010291 [Penicillium chermesinum]|uniref:Epoxide hydrolase N-terminal domain-containing protein n=1 Tax=Penicillium chermesinum TaxID=63820 RepID=A0A9W9NED8_9EURO|nr:uncharacterized protein N7468_010291 [Penicillium chermesinum]KAJ5217283.1 hypothetical protein N7468_010291 [Penicillium chermesinum]KAJ6171106.1 hypothetical protein N7470_000173 [Penicillium chermesinum]
MAKHFNVIPNGISRKLETPEPVQIGASTWWNAQNDPQLGVSRQWLIQAKETWLNNFDWRRHERYINSFPNFKILVKDTEAGQIDIHFAALFSRKKDAIPVVFLHGFPASFTEFLPMLELLTDKYTPETLPYHIVVPSLPGYGLSGSPSEDVEMSVNQSARLMNQFMMDLGFSDGYVVQGGDLGSMIARAMSVQYKECKALHINIPSDPGTLGKWRQTGLAYALEHGTRPSTVGLAISASPLSLLAWIGEKLLEWTDPRNQFSLETILNWVAFYWFTDTFPRSLYHATLVKSIMAREPLPITKEKPLGYSKFAYDMVVLPKPWAEILYPNLTFFEEHSEGGHFASLEQPKAFLEDIEEFVHRVRGVFTFE